MSFVIGDYGFDIISHETLKANGGITERFVIDGYYQDKPLNWHPNSDNHDFPDMPHRQIFDFIGKESVDVYENRGTEDKPDMVKVGTKRGADYRSNLWTILMLKAEKAQIASQGKRVIGQIADAELTKAAFVEPVDLKAIPLEQAKDVLVTSVAAEVKA